MLSRVGVALPPPPEEQSRSSGARRSSGLAVAVVSSFLGSRKPPRVLEVVVLVVPPSLRDAFMCSAGPLKTTMMLICLHVNGGFHSQEMSG